MGTRKPAMPNSEIRWTKSFIFVKQTVKFEIKEKNELRLDLW